MTVHAHLEALRGTKPHEFVMRFFLGGAITLIAALIARYCGPKVGGLFLAFPAIFPAGVTLLAKHEEQKKRQHQLDGLKRGKFAAALDARGAAMGTLGLFLFGLVVWMFVGRWPLIAVLVVATTTWLVSVVAVWAGGRRV
jgi:MFS family permease